MSEPLRGVIVSHAAVAEALLAAVAAITGVNDALVPVSNDGCDTGALAERLTRASGNKPAGLFGNLSGGSCPPSPRRPARGRARRHRGGVRVHGGSAAMSSRLEARRACRPARHR